jgi:Histidine kinase-like ATPase domain
VLYSGSRCSRSQPFLNGSALIDWSARIATDGSRQDRTLRGNCPMRSTTGGGTLRWRQAFSGEERSLRGLRHWLASLLPACPARDDVTSIANELGSNAIRHTASGRGGKFAVEITWSRAIVRVTVADGGAATGPHLIDDPAAEHGHGLHLVHGLASRTGVIENGKAVSSGPKSPGPIRASQVRNRTASAGPATPVRLSPHRPAVHVLST